MTERKPPRLNRVHEGMKYLLLKTPNPNKLPVADEANRTSVLKSLQLIRLSYSQLRISKSSSEAGTFP